MNSKECKATWTQEALTRATNEADEATFEGAERDAYIRERRKYHYDELEKLAHNPHVR
jgi:hypothetical protein